MIKEHTTMDSSLLPPSLYTIKGIIILDNDGKRVWANYYDPAIFETRNDQLKFEKNLFVKTSKTKADDVDVAMLDNLTILYKPAVDLFFYVLGGPRENELLLLSVLNCVIDSISQILRKNVEKSVLYDNMESIMLALDEICDNGIVLECDAVAVADRVGIRADDASIGKQTAAQVTDYLQTKWSMYRESNNSKQGKWPKLMQEQRKSYQKVPKPTSACERSYNIWLCGHNPPAIL